MPPISMDVSTEDTYCDKAIQVKQKIKYRSKSTNTKAMGVDVALSPHAIPSTNASTSPFKITISPCTKKMLSLENLSDVSSLTSESLVISPDMNSGTSTSEASWSNEDSDKEFKNLMHSGTLKAIEREPKLLIGLPKKSYYLIKLLSDNIPAPTVNILITLKKIKLNESFSILALQFGYTQSTISRIFTKTLRSLAEKMKELIVWPDQSKIVMHLPISFRARYSNVVSIIDCLEIEIEKPSDAVHQSLTWSQYKGCNTLKYLISCTPDGLVNFISEGYGGRASDVTIVENCGYLDKLAPNTAVMADRGFKNIAHILHAKRCVLIRPPSVSKTQSSSKDEVKESKRIAALRIHVERVISRLREYKMLLPHARIDHNLIYLMDEVLEVACGIINMQNVLIKV